MTRLALVRVPDGTPDPAGLIGWYTIRPPRRYAIVTDAAAWDAWVKEHAPEEVWPCGHIDKAFESAVRKWVALHGKWTCPHCTDDEHPDGIGHRPGRHGGPLGLHVPDPRHHRRRDHVGVPARRH
jgi:hypothetical protein